MPFTCSNIQQKIIFSWLVHTACPILVIMHNLSKSLQASSSKEIMIKMEETVLSIIIYQMLPQTGVGDKDPLAPFCHLPSAVTSVLRLEIVHQGQICIVGVTLQAALVRSIDRTCVTLPT